jgi:ADP-ribose pyrophosphatase YjhB (NUDIX family)
VESTRIGAYAVCTDSANRLLVCRIAPGYPDAGAWTLPGGGVEFGEDPNLAVLRELEEETGLTGRVVSVAAIDSHVVERPVTRPGPMHVVAILYRVEVTGGELRPELDGSTDICAWMSGDQLEHEPTEPFVDLARELTSRA